MGNFCTSPVDVDEQAGVFHYVTRDDTKLGGKVVKNLRFRDMYTMGRTIGAGGFSVVKLATNKATGEVWACKRMHLPSPGCSTNESGSSRDEVLKEIDILMSLDHPNIIYIKEYFEEESRVYIIMEYLEGGELLDVLINKGRYTEDDARVIFKQLIEGVRYLHGKGIVHRDLKLDNLLLTKPGNIHKIKIADFGLAKKYAQSSLSTICGTPHYIAPEVIKGGDEPYTYGKECDLWSCGVILFILLGGYPPFDDESEPNLFRRIRSGKYDMGDPVWSAVSDDAKDLIKKLLTVDPTKRLTIEGILEHPWMKEGEITKHKDLLGTVKKMRSSMRVKKLSF